MLWALFQAKCVKKSESVTNICVTGGSEESIIYIIFLKCCYSHSSVVTWVSFAPPPPHPRLQKMVLSDVLHYHFVHRYILKKFKVLITRMLN
jgi:hypothetical protein